MPDIMILNGDIRELCQELPDNSIDMIFTDPPYPKQFLPLFGVLGEVASRVLKPGGYLFTYSGQFYLPEVISSICSHGMVYFWTCATVHDGGTKIVRKGKEIGIQNGWKPILVFSKGKPSPRRVFTDRYTGNRSKVYHEWGQDEATAAYYIQCITQPGDTVLDPFCGGGTTAYACAQIDRNCITMDVDPDAVDVSRKRLKLIQSMLIPESELQNELWEYAQVDTWYKESFHG